MIGSTEVILIIVAALFLFGPQKLPELARSLGGAVGEFKRAQRAAELELTQFDAYTRKADNKFTPKVKEEDKEKYETTPLEKEENEEENKEKTDIKTT
jgi:sec-independent protein translocase protein TatA